MALRWSGPVLVRVRPRRSSVRIGAAVVLAVVMACLTPQALAQSTAPAVPLGVAEGSSLRVALDRRVTIKNVGQQVEAVLVDPVYAYDRVVIPAGARVIGHVERRSGVSKKRRAIAMLRGDFTPLHDILLQFDAVVLQDGRMLRVVTQVAPGTEQVTLTVASGVDKKKTVVSAATDEATKQAKDTASALKGPNKKERLNDAALRALPYHPEFLSKGTAFNARLMSGLDFGTAVLPAIAAHGTAPAPESILSARLLQGVNSTYATIGTPLDAIVTRPVFSAANELILPAGSKLTGKVTFVKQARHFRRNGQLRFLFDTVQPAGGESAAMLASLYSVESGRADRIAIDEEGGAKTTNSATRLVAPAIGALALVGLSKGHLDYDTDGAAPEMAYGGPVSGSVGGFVGASITGVLVASLGHPAAVALASIGVVRSTYTGIIGKGREVNFPADTRIQVQLSPGSGNARRDSAASERRTGGKPRTTQ
jgi:hypothetical protein